MEGLPVGELADAFLVAPCREAARGVQIRLAGVVVVDLGGEKFEDPAKASRNLPPCAVGLFFLSSVVFGFELARSFDVFDEVKASMRHKARLRRYGTR